MQMLIGNRLVFFVIIALISVLFLNHYAAANIINDHLSLTRSIAFKNAPVVDMPGQQPEGPLRWEIYEIIFGTFLLLVGLTLVVLYILRRKALDLSLISFGILCLLYGARTQALQFLFALPPGLWIYTHWFITYLVPIAGWFFAEQFLGKGWKSSIRRLLQAQIVFSTSAIILGVYIRDPAAAMVANNIMAGIGFLVILANLFQPHLLLNRELKVLRAGCLIFMLLALIENIGPLLTKSMEESILEALGFIIFIGCLVFTVARRFFRNEKELIAISHELKTAQQIQSFILPKDSVDVEDLQVAARYVPMASVAGDFYDFAQVDEKRLGILVADVSGHGVPASLISSMVKIAFASNIAHATNPAELLDAVNQVLCGKLESDFVTAGYVFLDTEEKNLIYAGAGHMPLLLWREEEKKIYELHEKGTILGQFEDIRFKNIYFALKPHDRIILYTDGIVEAPNTMHTLFGFDRLKEFITSHARLPAGPFADALIRQLFNWSGNPSGQALEDDLTLIVADYQHA